MATVWYDMNRAKTITLAAFSLRRDSLVVRTLEAASNRGARVSVVLAQGFGLYSRQNAETAVELVSHRVRVRLVRSSQQWTHIKAAIIDGQLYLSDRNWVAGSGDALVIRDSLPGDRSLVERSFLGQSGANEHLWTRKADALAAEAAMLATAHSHRVRISTESFGMETPVYRQLIRRRNAGDEVDLLISRSEYVHNRSEKAATSGLAAIGVRIRLSASNEKMAIDGTAVWMGSANATAGLPNQLDFGFAIASSQIAEKLRAQFDQEWEKANEI